MGTDIHAILEIKQHGKWQYISELPEMFDDRSYGIFAMLNKNVRNGNNIPGFEEKGYPKNLSGKKFRFISVLNETVKAFINGQTTVCYIGGPENKWLPVSDPALTVQTDEDTYYRIKNEPTENDLKRYSLLTLHPQKYSIQDAQQVGGVICKMPYTKLFKDVFEFSKEYYPYYEKVDSDLGYYEVDFDSKDYHSPSYLTLTELKSKVRQINSDKQYTVPTDFLVELENALGYLPEELVCKNQNNGTTIVMFETDDFDITRQCMYNDGIAELTNIQQKYKVADNEIRVVFAFDS